MSVVGVISTLCTTAVSVIGALFPAHVKDFIHKLKCDWFDSTVIYTDKNVDFDNVKTTSVITPEILKNVTEYSGYDQSFKASNDVVTVNKVNDKQKVIEV